MSPILIIPAKAGTHFSAADALDLWIPACAGMTALGGVARGVIVGPEVPIVAYVPADRMLLEPGAAVVAIARKAPDGSLEAGRIAAEKDGVEPRM